MVIIIIIIAIVYICGGFYFVRVATFHSESSI